MLRFSVTLLLVSFASKSLMLAARICNDEEPLATALTVVALRLHAISRVLSD